MENKLSGLRPKAWLTRKIGALAAGLLLGLSCTTGVAGPVIIEMDLPALDAVEQVSGYVVQAASVAAAAQAVESVGGKVTYEISSQHAVGASLLPVQVELLKRRSDVVRVSQDTRP